MPKSVPNEVLISLRSDTRFALSLLFPPLAAWPGNSQSRSTPWYLYCVMNDFNELIKVARFADDDVILDHACSVGLPVALNAKPPIEIHV